MARFSIERNMLDYILTDSQPSELTEIFTYNYLYNYLNKNSYLIENIYHNLLQKYQKDQALFDQTWNTQPLVYRISKKDGTYRRMSLMQPLSALQVSLFMRIYQKDILTTINSPRFSIRYHTKNNRLFYTSKDKYLIDYTYKYKRESLRRSIERSNSFFKLKDHNSVTSFINSNLWDDLMIKYIYYLKTDYKSCFDSIYTHTYKWIIARDSIDSRNLIRRPNSNIHVALDRVMQNVNGAVSNGLIVGPEFSRMVAEVLLQKIDSNIYEALKRKNIILKEDYLCFRYVDDIFVFANRIDVREEILKTIEDEASKFLISLNTNKTIVEKTPFVLNNWLKETKEVKDKIVLLFQRRENDEGDKWLVSFQPWELKNVKSLYTELITKYPKNVRSITSYILKVILNKFSENRKEYNLFRKGSSKKRKRTMIDFIFYVYQFSTSFDNTQKFISILYYLNLELNFEMNKDLINYIVQKYDVIFLNNHINDVINLLLTFSKYGLSLSYNSEMKIQEVIQGCKDPLLMASYLIYSRYDKDYFNSILKNYSDIIENSIARMSSTKDCLMYSEIWYIFIFNKCPFLSTSVQNKITSIIDSIFSMPVITERDKVRKLIFEFLKNNNDNFITWKLDTIDIAADITFRSRHRTIFRNYGKRTKIYDTSI